MIWKTCCALHNMLLVSDGLNNEWECTSTNEPNMDCLNGDIPFAISRLNNVIPRQLYADDTDQLTSNVGRQKISKQTINVVRELSHELFQQKLIQHFDICWRQNEIWWPSQMKN